MRGREGDQQERRVGGSPRTVQRAGCYVVLVRLWLVRWRGRNMKRWYAVDSPLLLYILFGLLLAILRCCPGAVLLSCWFECMFTSRAANKHRVLETPTVASKAACVCTFWFCGPRAPEQCIGTQGTENTWLNYSSIFSTTS